MIKPITVLAMLVGGSASTLAIEDKYHITASEHAACDDDAKMLCSSAEDEDTLIACMRSKRFSLSKPCIEAFNAGLKQRNLR